jgi:hypothetical protein
VPETGLEPLRLSPTYLNQSVGQFRHLGSAEHLREGRARLSTRSVRREHGAAQDRRHSAGRSAFGPPGRSCGQDRAAPCSSSSSDFPDRAPTRGRQPHSRNRHTRTSACDWPCGSMKHRESGLGDRNDRCPCSSRTGKLSKEPADGCAAPSERSPSDFACSAVGACLSSTDLFVLCLGGQEGNPRLKSEASAPCFLLINPLA